MERSHRKKRFFSAAAALLALCLLAACAPAQQEGGKPVSLAVSGMKTEFFLEEEFSAGDLAVTVALDDGTVRTAEPGEYTVDSSAFNSDFLGEYPISVQLNGTGLSQSYNVTVRRNWRADGVLRILCIGNSFSDDMMEYVWQIADSLGVEEISLGNLYIGGCSLDTHADNAAADAPAYEYRTNTAGRWTTAYNVRMSEAIAAQDWDFISFQQQSGTSGVAASYARLGELLDYVRSIAGTAQFVWHMTWAYQKNSPNPEFANYGRSQDAMYESIVAAVRSEVLAQPEISAVIPSGTAIQNARTSFVGDTLTRDGYHLSLGLGRYIAGLTLVRALTGLSVEKIAYAPSGVSERERAVAAEAAETAVAEPFAVTQSFDPE